jgi:hypothetical protein
MRTTSAPKISVAIEKLAVVLASNRLIKADRCTRLSLNPQLRSYSAFVKFERACVSGPAAVRLAETLPAFYQIT